MYKLAFMKRRAAGLVVVPVLPAVLPALFLVLFSVGAVSQGASPADAIALEQQGRLPEAAQAWKAVTQQDPKDAQAFARLGGVLSKQEKYPEAASAYRKALALDSKLPGVELNLGLAEFKQGHFKAAAPAFRLALTADPTSDQARTLLGMSYYGAEKFAEAVEYLQPAAKSDPGNLELRRLLAQSCLWAKNYSCAFDEFRQVLERNPHSAPAHMLYAEALDGLGKTPEAIAEFQAAAQAAPREPNVHFGLGYLYWKSDQYDDARREFKAELALDPDHAQTLAYLGDTEMKTGNLEAALPLLRKSLQLKKDIRVAAIDIGVILVQQKHYADAVAAFQHAIALDPAEPDAHYRLGRVYQEMGRREESQKEFAKVRELKAKQDQKGEDLARKMSSAPPPLNAPPMNAPQSEPSN
jgi:tetratricopeptide (TPR) repeat protein